VHVECADFLRLQAGDEWADVCLANPPFERNQHLEHVIAMLRHAPCVVGLFPASFEFSVRRDRELWSKIARVVRRARLPARVDFGGTMSGSLDSVVLKIVRRDRPRAAGVVEEIVEEVWIEGEE
jgi:hypothetical protein